MATGKALRPKAASRGNHPRPDPSPPWEKNSPPSVLTRALFSYFDMLKGDTALSETLSTSLIGPKPPGAGQILHFPQFPLFRQAGAFKEVTKNSPHHQTKITRGRLRLPPSSCHLYTWLCSPAAAPTPRGTPHTPALTLVHPGDTLTVQVDSACGVVAAVQHHHTRRRRRHLDY